MSQQVCIKCKTDVDETNLFSLGGCIIVEKSEIGEIKVYLCSECRSLFWSDFVVNAPF